MIKVENISWSFPQKDLFDHVSFTIEDNRHCALIGSNGTGKTTLVDILVNPDKYLLYTGHIETGDDCRFGYVSQFVSHEKAIDKTVYQYLCEDFEKIQAETEEVCSEMAEAEDLDALMDRYQLLLDEFQAVDGDNYEINIRHELQLAGLDRVSDVPVALISGGEYKLLQIIRQMLRRPTVLVMDEPDVFLDFENITGLRDLINGYRGTLLAVTHSRYLLNSCFDKILHLENGDIQEFDGGYVAYTYALMQTKAEEQQTADKEQEFIDLQAALVDRLRDDATEVIDPARGRSLHARVSYLERLQKKHIKEPFVEMRHPAIRLPSPDLPEAAEEETAPVVIRADGYEVGFGSPLLQDVSFEIRRGEKAALIGPNGTGKTTLLRQLIRGESPALKLDENAHTAFLSQTWEDITDRDTDIEGLMREYGFTSLPQITAYLRGYCFEEEEMHDRLDKLSGGERNLLQLACIARTDADLLLLDEPTSHLDTWAQQELEKAIRAYPGTVLMVSHDFYTVANCADFILYVENGTIRRMSSRAFRKMIYRDHFSKEYLELEQKRRDLEARITAALEDGDSVLAAALCQLMEPLVTQLSR